MILGTGTLADGAATATAAAKRVPVGTHDVAVSYSGDTFVKYGVGAAQLTATP